MSSFLSDLYSIYVSSMGSFITGKTLGVYNFLLLGIVLVIRIIVMYFYGISITALTVSLMFLQTVYALAVGVIIYNVINQLLGKQSATPINYMSMGIILGVHLLLIFIIYYFFLYGPSEIADDTSS